MAKLVRSFGSGQGHTVPPILAGGALAADQRDKPQ